MGLLSCLCSVGLVISVTFATTVPSKALEERDSDCPAGPGWALPVLTIGGQGGTSSCETSFGNDYSPISGIEVWRKGDGDDDGDRISGLQFTYASGKTSQIYGQEDTSKYPSATLTLVPGELIKNTILYGNGKGEWLGHIHIETTKQTFDAGRDTSSIDPYGVNVGSGLLFGAKIATSASDISKGDDIQSLAFLFLNEAIDHIDITDVTFKSDPEGSNAGISPQNVVVGQWYNGADSNVGYSLTPTYAVTESYSVSQQTAFSFGGSIQIEVDAELFGIGAKETDSFTWAVSSESATTTGTTSATSVACVATGTLAPSQGVKVTGSYQTGKGSFDYTSTVTVHLKDGTSFDYEEDGTLVNVAYNQCSTTWTEQDDPNISNSPGLHTLSSGSGSLATTTKTTASAMMPSATAGSNSTVGGGGRKFKRARSPFQRVPSLQIR